MSLFGWMGKQADFTKDATVRSAVLIREIYADARALLHDEHDLEKAEKKIKEGIKTHVRQLLANGDQDALADLKSMFQELKKIGVAEVVLFHRILQEAIAMYKENKGIANALPDSQKTLAEMEKLIKEFAGLANDLGNKLKSVAGSG